MFIDDGVLEFHKWGVLIGPGAPDWFSNQKWILVAEGPDLWIPVCALIAKLTSLGKGIHLLRENVEGLGKNKIIQHFNVTILHFEVLVF